jgi:Holliday junction resolvasome RuvABC endonuclease subunit
VLGIDCSTKSLGFALFDGTTPVHCGELFFKGDSMESRLSDCHKMIPPMVASGLLKADFIGFEGAWLGPNPQTGLDLAYVYGAAIGALMDDGTKLVRIAPLSWQGYIGNPALKKPEKEAIKAATPGKSETWYKNQYREFRKQRTLAYSRKFFKIESGSDNVGDAVAIAYYTANHLTKR